MDWEKYLIIRDEIKKYNIPLTTAGGGSVVGDRLLFTA